MSNDALPLLPLRRGVILPGRLATLPVGRNKSLRLARALRVGDALIVASQHEVENEDPTTLEAIHPIGVRVRVRDKAERGRRGVVLVVQAEGRVRLDELIAAEPIWRVRVSDVDDDEGDREEADALAKSLRKTLGDWVPAETTLLKALADANPGLVADLVAGWVDAPQSDKLEVLDERSVGSRLRLALRMMKEARARAELQSKVDSEVRRDLNKQQREQILRKQLDAIRKELGELGSETDDDPMQRLRDALDAAALDEDTRKVADRELRRLESLPAQSPEGNVIRTYLEVLSELPWSKRADVSTNLEAIEEKLDRDHYGLDEVKRRILEHMAVLKLAPRARGTLLCLVGPPGVGKTSLAQSIADATGRPLVRVSLGGVRDESEIRGHRRTYIGAMPGRIMNAMRKAEVKNPVVVLDEIDKVGGRNWAGDPEAALLELLDPEQNDKFVDHYVDVPFDLSEVLFIATANQLGTLSTPLLDRLEIIEVSGYTHSEKAAIAERHLIPKEVERHGLTEHADAIRFGEGVLERIVADYTREAGVRQLGRQIAKILRDVALDVAREKELELTIDADRMRRVLGKPRFRTDAVERERPAGVAAGLAWTPVGGDVLYIETTSMPGKGKVEITGQLGDVMNESARAALAYVRTHAETLEIDPNFLDQRDLHVHVPAGGTPKDGPSAGVTMFTAFASLLTGRRVRPDTAMTGEATLRGRVLPVGGIKSKVLAAHRAGFTRVLLPHKNAPDLEEIPDSVRNELDIVLVQAMDEVLEHALETGADHSMTRVASIARNSPSSSS